MRYKLLLAGVVIFPFAAHAQTDYTACQSLIQLFGQRDLEYQAANQRLIDALKQGTPVRTIGPEGDMLVYPDGAVTKLERNQ